MVSYVYCNVSHFFTTYPRSVYQSAINKDSKECLLAFLDELESILAELENKSEEGGVQSDEEV